MVDSCSQFSRANYKIELIDTDTKYTLSIKSKKQVF